MNCGPTLVNTNLYVYLRSNPVVYTTASNEKRPRSLGPEQKLIWIDFILKRFTQKLSQKQPYDCIIVCVNLIQFGFPNVYY